jgi:hypothetical protein
MSIAKQLALVDSAESFYQAIPTELRQNIEFRISLHKFLATDTKAQQVYLELCRQYMPIVFSSTFWTINPQKPPGQRNQPFILRPVQKPAVETLNWCIDNEHDAGLNKTRKQGASEICCKLFSAKALLENDCHFIIGSRTKSLVDNFGDPTTLFAKVDNVFECLPSWWKKLCGYNPKINRKDMVLTVPATNSSFAGDTTNENFSAGSRGTGVLLDEFGRVDYSVAESIEGSVHDVANCVIYSSTHWLGVNHTFNKCLNKATTKVVELMWYDNPEEMAGLYTTDSIGSYEIIDKDYYKDKDLDSAVVLDSINKYDPTLDRIQFVADGLKGIPSPYRAPWFDTQELKRRGNKRDFICNVCATPLGASDSPFDQEVLSEIKKTTIRHPDIQGEIIFEYDFDGLVDETETNFYPNYGERKLKWWGELQWNRPDQRHNYVIGIDPSYGLGSANSAAVIMDVNTKEQVGAWTASDCKPEDFADMMVALAYWVGGLSPAFLIWESNAGCGVSFGNRVVHNGYYAVYSQRREDSKTRKKTQKWGWQSGEKQKEQLLGEFGVALSGGLSGDDTYLSFIIRDELLLDELFDYVFKEKGKGIIQSSKADLSTGAVERHGDRGIAAGLCVLGCKEQQKGDYKHAANPPAQSFEYYRKIEEARQVEEKRLTRRFLY